MFSPETLCCIIYSFITHDNLKFLFHYLFDGETKILFFLYYHHPDFGGSLYRVLNRRFKNFTNELPVMLNQAGQSCKAATLV